jgi:hypothetical protein
MACGLVLAVATAGSALAQNTVGELLAAGGKRLTKDEVLAALHDVTLTGPIATGGETELEWKADGTVSGYMVNATGRRGSIVGTWKVQDSGEVCRDFEMRFRENTQVKDCFPIYRLGDAIYFPAKAGPDAAVPVQKRTVKH